MSSDTDENDARDSLERELTTPTNKPDLKIVNSVSSSSQTLEMSACGSSYFALDVNANKV